MKQSLILLEEQEKLKKTITILESEKARLIEDKRVIERSRDNFKNGLSCIVYVLQNSPGKLLLVVVSCCVRNVATGGS